MMDIQLNELSKKEFDPALINEITPDTGYSIWTKKDPFGRAYFGVGNFCGMDRSINEDTDLSWMSFTLRFWKKREGSGLDENMECNQPVIRWSN